MGASAREATHTPRPHPNLIRSPVQVRARHRRGVEIVAVTTRRTTVDSVRGVAPLRECDIDAGIIPRLRDVVRAQPHAVAVADARGELTYAQVAARAASVLATVRRGMSGLTPAAVTAGPETFGGQEPVGMLFGHTTEAVCALVGVLASGHPVLVLDPRTPAARLQRLVATAGVRVVVSDRAGTDLARELTSHVVLPFADDAQAEAETLWATPPAPTSVAALAFTSGSTGTPKPVANDHRLLVRDAWNSSAATACYDANDTIAHTLPIAFHAGLTTTVHGLVVGARMRLYDTRGSGISGLPRFIADNACTVMISSPAILRAFCALSPDPALLTTLRTLTIAGETAYGPDVEEARRLLPSTCVVRNRYGSSETGLIAEYPVANDHPPLTGPLPVGHGVGRTCLGLLDADGEPVPPGTAGATGTLTVTAPSVALGYWNLPDATAAAFTDNADGTRTYRSSDVGRMLHDGTLQVIGRADHSVKVRGYLVDPGEVDAELFALPDVVEAVVVGTPRTTGEGHRLTAYVVSSAAEPSASALRMAVRRSLPGHMVPEQIVFVEALPRNDRGKIDRAALPAPPPPVTAGSSGVSQTLTHWEELVTVVWTEVLDVEAIDLDDDFFGLGGDSLAAEELITRVRDDLGVSGDVADSALLAEAPVLRDFARRLLQSGGEKRRALVTLQPHGDGTPLFVVVGGGGLGIAFVPLARRLGTDYPVHALQSPVIEERGLPERSVRAMARRHIARLRTVQPHGPYRLAGHSFGGLLAFEMAHQLRGAGEEVELLVLLDSFPPDPDAYPAGGERGLVSRVRSQAGLVRAALRDTSGGSEAWRFFNQADDLSRRYRGRPWDGPTLVVVADSPHRAERGAWAPFLTNGHERVDVAGGHITMLRPPWVDDVAGHVARVLDGGVTPTPGAPAAHADAGQAPFGGITTSASKSS